MGTGLTCVGGIRRQRGAPALPTMDFSLPPRDRGLPMTLAPNLAYVFSHPGAFALRVLKGFRANQGLLLAGAVAYYALLSIVPLLILIAIALSHFVDAGILLETIGRYLEWLVPGQSRALVAELAAFLQHGDTIG